MSSFISHAVSAKIHDLAIVNSVIRVQDGSSGDSTAIAALIDKVDAGTQISNIYTNAYIRGRMASGGIAGMVRNGTAGTIDGCIFNGVLAVNAIGTRTDYSAGGIVGQFESNSGSCYTVSNCLNMGVLDLSDTTVSVYVGGIVGGKSNGIGNLSNCISAMTVVDTKETKTALGMISGTASTGVKASNCVYDAAKAPTGTYAVKGATSNASGFTSVANLADLDVSAWSAWTHLTADIPVPTAAWNLAERTFDDVALSFVQETDVTTIDKGDSLYTGYTVRLVAEVYDLDADVAGFEVWNGNKYVELGHSTTVYKSLNAKGEDGEIGQVKADYGKYFTAIEINVASGMVQTFTVRPYTVIEGQYVYGAAYTITYNAQGQFVSAVLAK